MLLQGKYDGQDAYDIGNNLQYNGKFYKRHTKALASKIMRKMFFLFNYRNNATRHCPASYAI